MSQREPERLVHDREIGKLISRANEAYLARLDESRAFQRLSERLERPERSVRWRGLTLGAVLSAAAGVVLVLGLFGDALFGDALFGENVFDKARGRVALGPELSTGRRMLRDGAEPSEAALSEAEPGVEAQAAPVEAQRASADDAVGSVGSQPRAAGRAKPAPRELGGNATSHDVARVAVPSPRSAPSPPRERQVARGEAAVRSEPSPPNGGAEAQVVAAPELAAPVPAMAANGEAPSSAAREVAARVDCSDLVEKDALAAEHCYAQRAAESSGLSAEVALYELARLRRDVQQDAKGALAALNEYRDRFPQGSLRNEVGLSRVELLSALGRSREALNEAEALLGSAKGSERAAELHLLRGDIFRRDLADFAQAAQEYSKAEKFGGGFGAEATRLRGLSLEALGDVEGALAAYRRYLSGPDQPRKGEVHRRVEALTSGQGAKP